MEYDPAKDAHDSYCAAIEAKRLRRIELRLSSGLTEETREQLRQIDEALRHAAINADKIFVGENN